MLLISFGARECLGEGLVRRVVQFTCDGKQGEGPYLVEAEPDRINYTIPWEGPFRWAELGQRVIYGLPVAKAESAKIELHCGNRFQISLSPDAETWTVALREERPVTGLSNLEWRTVDATRFLGGEKLYLKLEHSLPDKPGFGGCLFEVKLNYTRPDETVPLVTAGRATAPPRIDGALDDEAWRGAQQCTPFWVLNLPREARQQTIARVAWDDETLYLALDCREARPEAITSVTRERDGEVYRDSAVEWFLQPLTEERYYHLAANSLGVMFDQIGANDPTGWNPDWQCGARMSETGWAVEAAVPFRSLGRGTPVAGEQWRLNMCRVGTSDAELCTWAPLSGGFHQPDRFGILRFGTMAGAWARVDRLPQWQRGPVQLTGAVASTTQPTRIRLDVVPQQGSVCADSVTPGEDGRFALTGAITAYGKGHACLTTVDDTGRPTHRVAMPYEVRPQAPPPLALQLRQPYYTDEDSIRATVRIGLAADELEGARLAITLVRGEEIIISLTSAMSTAPIPITIPLAELAEGDYRLRASLTSGEGEKIAAVQSPVHRLPAYVTPSRVGIRDDGVTVLNGKPFLPVILFLAQGGEEVALTGNTVIFGGEDPDKCARQLDLASEHGLMAMPHLCNLMRGNNDWEGLRATVSRNKNHPALLAWYLADEPEGSGDVPDILLKARSIIREIDPDHPIAGLNNTPSVFAAYRAVFDVHLADPYPIPRSPVTLVSDWTDVSRRVMGQGKPTWMCLQTFDPSRYGMSGGRYPTADELSCMAYLALTHGAKGIGWWAWGHMKENNWERYRRIAAQLKALEPYLLSEQGGGGVTVDCDAAGLHISVHRLGDAAVVLIANPGEETQARLSVAGMQVTRVKGLFDHGVVASAENAFEIVLPAMGTGAYLVE